MPIASSPAELEQQIMEKMKTAANMARLKTVVHMRVALQSFYAGGHPVMYKRTGQLGNTPIVTTVSGGGRSLTYDAYLNEGGGYSTGCKPSMSAVLQLANYGSYGGLRPTVGASGFWERALTHIENDLNSSFAIFF